MWLSTGTGRVLSISSVDMHRDSERDVLRCTEMFFLCSQLFRGYGCKFSSHKLGLTLSVFWSPDIRSERFCSQYIHPQSLPKRS